MRLALAAIASELGLDLHDLPGGIAGVLIAFRAAAYGEGCREALRLMGRRRSDQEDTPLVRSEE